MSYQPSYYPRNAPQGWGTMSGATSQQANRSSQIPPVFHPQIYSQNNHHSHPSLSRPMAPPERSQSRRTSQPPPRNLHLPARYRTNRPMSQYHPHPYPSSSLNSFFPPQQPPRNPRGMGPHEQSRQREGENVKYELNGPPEFTCPNCHFWYDRGVQEGKKQAEDEAKRRAGGVIQAQAQALNPVHHRSDSQGPPNFLPPSHLRRDFPKSPLREALKSDQQEEDGKLGGSERENGGNGEKSEKGKKKERRFSAFFKNDVVGDVAKKFGKKGSILGLRRGHSPSE